MRDPRIDELEHRLRDRSRKVALLEQTIRELQVELTLMVDATEHLPRAYARELTALAAIAYGPGGNGDSPGAGKSESNGSRLPSAAYAALQREQHWLEQRAARDPATGTAAGTLARVVDRLESA